MASLPLPITPNPHFSRSRYTQTRKSINVTTTHLPNFQNNEQRFPISYKSYFHHISSLCKEGQLPEALAILTEMELEGFQIGPEIYGELLQGCVYERALFTGQQIHARILKNGDFFSSNEYIETKLVIFYAKCDLPEVATELFQRLRKQNVFSWAAMIGLYCRIGCNEEALLGVCEMHENGYFPDNFVVPNALKACSALQLVKFGKGVHGYVIKMGFDCCVFVASSVVDMYGKCGVLEDARKVFNLMPERNVVAWNSMIVGCVQNGLNEETMEVLYNMRVEGIEPTRVTIASFLSAAANLDAIEEGRQVHAIAVLSGLELDNILGTSFINFYAKVGKIEDAELIFSRMNERDVVTWNLLISSYVQDGQVETALDICHQMRTENLRFDSVTLASILSAFADSSNIKLGKVGHCYCIKNNFVSDVVVSSSIINMYAKCGKIEYARRVFNTSIQSDLVLWNTLIAAYAELGLSGEALKLFYQMQLEGVPPNLISWNSVILGFLKNSQVNEARDLFLQMQSAGVQPNLITWTTLINGLAQNGYGYEATLLFQKMQAAGIQPNVVSIVCVLSACTTIASLLYGRTIHGYVMRHEISTSPSIVTSLVDMYAKCGSIDLAKKVFDSILNKELPCYNAMILGHALHGQPAGAFAFFEEMKKEKIQPDGITFTGLLSACSHAGLVDKGLEVFTEMFSKYHVMPSKEHYGCLVTLLSRCGSLEGALRFILTMPIEPDAHILGSLLAACREHNETGLGKYLSEHLFKLEPDNSGNYIAVSNIYASTGKWDEVSQLRDLMKQKGLRKDPGCSLIQIGEELHVFVAGDGSHPQTEVIYHMLCGLEREMRFMGYVTADGNIKYPASKSIA